LVGIIEGDHVDLNGANGVAIRKGALPAGFLTL
jgi:hypothetical protein